MAKGLFFALEDADVVVEPEITELVPETTAEVEEAAGEVAEQTGEIAELEQTAEVAEADAGTLGDIQEVLQESVESGEGVDEKAAEIAEIAVEAIRARLGMPAKRTLPALESFGSKNSRLTATKVALESVGDTIKKIWEGIKRVAAMIWEKVKAFFIGLVKNRNMLVKHLEAQKAQLAKISSAAKPAEKELTGGFVGALSAGGKVDTAKVLDSSAKLLEVSMTASQHMKSFVQAAMAGNDKHDLKTPIVAAIKTLGANGSGYGSLVNNKTIEIKEEENKLSLNIVEGKGKSAEKAKALTQGEIGSLIDSALALAKDIQEFEKVQDNVAKVKADIEKLANSMIDAAGKAVSDESKTQGAAFNKDAEQIRELNALIPKFGAALPTLSFQAAKAASDYAGASMRNLKTEEKK